MVNNESANQNNQKPGNGGGSIQNSGNKGSGQTTYHADAPGKVKLKKVKSKGTGKLQIK